ncbi:MAG: alpha amylase C-terminal domain-containing protein [Victivallales bacterium]|nr:alpha amylase C-terminal domain-containing protein [Victivallales bacterium]
MAHLNDQPLPKLFQGDPYLAPYLENYLQRETFVADRRQELLGNHANLREVADWHLYYGLHRTQRGTWRFREWLPYATAATLLGEFNHWTTSPWFELHPLGNGDWEVEVPEQMLAHGQAYQLFVEWPGGSGWRLPSAANSIVRERRPDGSCLFNARVWDPVTPYHWQHDDFTPPSLPLIYESHIGIAQQEPRVGTYREFREKILPRIADDGYTCVQFMAIAQHPYYASFGYHVANYFAPCDLFGTPDDFKALVDAAHGRGLRVIMDLVHSHSVRNELEGLARLSGRLGQFFHDDIRGSHPAWDSYCFDYSKTQVLRFLLSNCRYWIEEFHVDGFRFDGVTSMLYFDHGLNHAFTSYDHYFSPNVDWDSVAYLTLANELCHQCAYTPEHTAWTIAEDVSGMPGLGMPVADGGMGFDYRLAMGVTDFWFKLLDQPDEAWDLGTLWHELTNRRQEEKTISYVECHDQAIVGGQTFLFRAVGNAMYDAMDLASQNLAVERGVALHKLARLATIATAGGGYLNFIGNEFGHPEWLDLPRAGNQWSYDHARRRWDLCDDPTLRFQALNRFDHEMLALVRENPHFFEEPVRLVKLHQDNHVLAFSRGDLLFVFNFHPTVSFENYPIPAQATEYLLRLDTDATLFNGFGRVQPDQHFYALTDTPDGPAHISLYLPTRAALVLKFITD